MKNSSFEKLKEHPFPIDYQSARIGFFKGEHFNVEFTEDRPKRRLTMETPPKRPQAPENARDHAGIRNGRMTAQFFLRQTANGQSSWWVVKCDCGKYELRKKLGKWTSKHDGNDMCEICEREAEMLSGLIPRKSKAKMGERLFKWIDSMRALGLTDEEIVAIRQGDITTKGKDKNQIRAALKGALVS